MYHDIFPNEVDQWTRAGAALIDVREPYEYEGGHVPGAKNIPLSSLSEHLNDVPDNVVLVCASGNRSGQAAHYLTEERGYNKVANLMGGTFAWLQRGLPIED